MSQFKDKTLLINGKTSFFDNIVLNESRKLVSDLEKYMKKIESE